MTVHTRPLRTQDLLAVAALDRELQYQPWSATQFADCLQPHYVSRVLTDAERVIGFCILQPVLDEANLLLMGIATGYQSQGLGKKLLTASLQALPETITTVFLEVRESNVRAIHLYESQGFHRIGIRPKYYPSRQGREDAVLMAQTLRIA